MALLTNSSFFYGLTITTANRFLDFKEGANFFVAELPLGSYTGSSISNEIKKQLEAQGANTYTVSYNRATRKFTISANAPFDILAQSGVNSGQSAYTLLGFDQSTDKTGASSYVGENSTGKVYRTQFPIQNYKPTSLNRRAIDGVVNKSSSGVVEVVKFGNERFMSGEMNFITSIPQVTGSKVDSNPNGVADYISFVEYCTEKGPVEFMENADDVTVYQTFLLESTEQDPKGLDYELIELYDRGLPSYFRSGNLRFKLIEV